MVILISNGNESESSLSVIASIVFKVTVCKKFSGSCGCHWLVPKPAWLLASNPPPALVVGSSRLPVFMVHCTHCSNYRYGESFPLQSRCHYCTKFKKSATFERRWHEDVMFEALWINCSSNHLDHVDITFSSPILSFTTCDNRTCSSRSIFHTWTFFCPLASVWLTWEENILLPL